MQRFHRSLVSLSVVTAFGCGAGVEAPEEEGSGQRESEIIGGSTLSPDVGTRRSMGLVDVENTLFQRCSGALFHPDWVLTAAHCITGTGFGTKVRAPRTDGGYDERTADYVRMLGQNDLALVRLLPASASMMWPSVTRSMTADLNGIVGKSVTCYGRGQSAYASNGSPAPTGVWKKVTKTVAAYSGSYLRIDSNNGNDIPAYGDSGGPCFFGENIIGVISKADGECSDPSTPERCRATLTRMDSIFPRITGDYLNFIAQMPNRPVEAFYPLNVKSPWDGYANDWVGSEVDGVPETGSTNQASFTFGGNGDVVTFHGRMTTATANSSPFTIGSHNPSGGVAYVPVLVNSNLQAARLKIDTAGGVALEFKGAAPAGPYLMHLDGVHYLEFGVGAEALPLGPGWSKHNATRTPSAVKMPNGFVHLMGGLVGSNNASLASPFTLATGLRPPADTYVNITMCNATKGRLFIRSNGAVSIQAEGTNDTADARCFTSLDGVSFATSVIGASGVAYKNNWSTASPSDTLRFRNDGGIVRFQGAVVGGTANTVITLPPAFRPSDAVFLPIDRTNTTKGSVAVLITGDVVIIPGPGGGLADFTSFDGVSFAL